MSFGIYYEITNACNLRCKTCLPSSANPRKGELKTEQIIKFALKLFNAKANSFFITGGEPLLHPQIELILDTLGKIGYSTSLVTNGYNLNRNLIALFKKYNTSINISLDGATSDTNDFVRGKGSFDKAIESIKTLSDQEIKVILSCTVSQINFNELYNIGKIALTNNCKKILFTEVVKGGRAKANWNFLELQETERNKLPAIIENISQELFNDKSFVSDGNCWVDGSNIFVNSTGDAYLCSEIYQQKPELSISNVSTEQGIDKILSRLNIDNTHAPCCYEVYSSEHVALIANLKKSCALVS